MSEMTIAELQTELERRGVESLRAYRTGGYWQLRATAPASETRADAECEPRVYMHSEPRVEDQTLEGALGYLLELLEVRDGTAPVRPTSDESCRS